MMTCNTKKEPNNPCKSNENKMFINSLHYENNINAVIIFYEAQQNGLLIFWRENIRILFVD